MYIFVNLQVDWKPYVVSLHLFYSDSLHPNSLYFLLYFKVKNYEVKGDLAINKNILCIFLHLYMIWCIFYAYNIAGSIRGSGTPWFIGINWDYHLFLVVAVNRARRKLYIHLSHAFAISSLYLSKGLLTTPHVDVH